MLCHLAKSARRQPTHNKFGMNINIKNKIKSLKTIKPVTGFNFYGNQQIIT